MPVGLVFDPRYRLHDTRPGHPEQPDRLVAIDAAVKDLQLTDQLVMITPGPADNHWVQALHDPDYIARVRLACEHGQPWIDTPDSAIGPRSYEVAMLAVGGVLAAADAVIGGAVDHAFCAVRPPGHHAERDRSMGFCLFNNIAIAAQYLISQHGLGRVAIVDFDVHHGNGTQHLFESRRDVLFISLHQDPSTQYPGTGFAHETGIGEGEGFTVNLPIAPGGGDDTYQQLFEDRVIPTIDRFAPDALLISAGFDAAQGDPLAQMQVSPTGFGWMTQQLVDTAERHAQGRLISVLEGGYSLSALRASVAEHLRALVG